MDFNKETLEIEVSQDCAYFLKKQAEFQGVSTGRIVEELVKSFVHQEEK